ncbi:uncharacterized protein [Anoplolepis gracilipes]|uniref:uncharacterized protein isoform X2 n=1 Tax=Anoplolepis gracilipes TaxID=354296 RepID=UPI003BA35709
MSRKNRKQKSEEEKQKINDGEQENFFSEEMKEEIKMMWEIPQIFHFLHLARESLNIPPFSIYEMERMLLIPRASKQLANIMTCLLSSPITKAKVRKVPPMPYAFWTNILTHKVASWFKVYQAKHKDATKVLETIGIEPEFWNVFPNASIFNGKYFEDLSFRQRIWLLKTVCDTIMHTRKTVQEDIAKQPWEDQFETLLGVDRYGTRYMYFPQFIPTDLRIYRHCLDNRVLSTVKPVRPREETETGKLVGARLSRYKQKKMESYNNSSARRSTRHSSIKNNDLNYKCYDSSASSLISEDTNLSNTSTCTNNNISLNTINRKRCRSLSKMSEESALSNARSSGYDTNTSSDNKSVDNESSSVFKGFVNTQNDNCGIGIINEMLDDLKSEIDEERRANECGSNSSELSQEIKAHKNADSCEILAVERDENERLSDNLSNSSKTDDEKLNDIISAENSKLPESVHTKSLSASDNVSDISILTSKSDDQKLSETKTSSSNVIMTLNDSLCASPSIDDSVSLTEKITKFAFHVNKVKGSSIIKRSDYPIDGRNLRKIIQSRCKVGKEHNNERKIELIKYEKLETDEIDEMDKIDETEEKNYSANELDLQEDVESDLDNYTNNSNTGYNLRSSKDPKTDEYKKNFDKMLSDLGASDFRLIVDTVEGLRDLINSFSESTNSENNITIDIAPQCEITLVENLTELLNFLEPIEGALKDTMRKARAKLQREWSNFKEGNVEDQDSSSEGGLNSNWWVLGSQGRDPLSSSGDATLQTLPQLTLSSLGTQSSQQQHQSTEGENTVENSEQSRRESREASGDERWKGNGDKQSDVEVSSTRRKQVEEGGKKQELNKQPGENESASNDEDTEQQTRRVLRTRGVSSYTEQLYSDDESDENELEEWTDIEAVYAAPGAQDDTSASHSSPKVRHVDDQSEEEDSDQDWILPGSRKRKNKRPSANRRLKSFQHKVQSITENTSQNNVAFSVPHLANAKISKDKFKVKLKSNKETTEFEKTRGLQGTHDGSNTVVSTTNKVDPKRAVSTTNAVCKLESVESVHSELDIKDEGPIYESNSNHYVQNNFGFANQQQNYYYVMQQNPGIAAGENVMSPLGAPVMQQSVIVQGIASPQVQGYYVQPGPQPSYVMQNSQTNFLPAAQQQPVFQQQDPQMMATQPYVNSVSYVPYVVATSTQPQEYMVAPMTNQQNPLKPQNRCNQNNRYMTISRQNSQQPNSMIIRSNNTPVRDICQKTSSSKPARGNVPQQRTSKTTPQRRAPQTSSTKNSGQKTTSLIMLSDSDDEIEMIITEKTSTLEKEARLKQASRNDNESRQKPVITSDITVASAKGVIPPQIIQRMSQGGISITPVKTTPPPPTNANTQLVVVVNETGSHYALALPNGSKLILTPEQVAQIRASNGGKLIL